MIQVFIDASVLFSASYSSTGASREIIRFALRNQVKLVLSALVIEEVERNIKAKAPQALPLFQGLFIALPFETIDPTKADILRAATCVALKDAPILAAARKAHADYLVTLDRQHLVGIPGVAACAEVDIILPEELLKKLRSEK